MAIAAPTVVRLERGYVRVTGPEAADFLERMLSNEVASLTVGEARQALLLTPKSRIVAPLRVVREGDDSFLLLTEAELAGAVAGNLLRARFAAKCEIEVQPLHGYLRLGPGEGIRNDDYGVEAFEGWSAEPVEASDPAELEPLRIQAATPAWGKELDDSVLPAEAGLETTHISFTKGCYPGQEPVARLHHRGHPNRGLRVLVLENAQPGDELIYEGKVVGRITSAVPGRALAYVRREVPEEARLHLRPKRP